MSILNLKRVIYFVLAITTISLGLASRAPASDTWPAFIATYAGDTLWATLVYLVLCILFPAKKTLPLALTAIAFAFSMEFSQFYHAPWIENIRNTTLGGLILGFGFKASDLLCYLAGVMLGSLISLLIETSLLLKPALNQK